MRLFAVLCLCVVAAAPVLAQNRRPNPFKEKFEALDDKRDHAAIVAHWRTNPARVLGTIDSYLEGALGMWEKAKGEPDQAKVNAMHARAIRGAMAADEAFMTSMFSDYASSFAGWTDDEKKAFRGGQKAFGEARQAMRKEDWAGALAASQRCVEVARPLGDWWGTAMGFGGMGKALMGLGKPREALDALGAARQINFHLRLERSELGNLLDMLETFPKVNAAPRARVALGRMLNLATKMKAVERMGPVIDKHVEAVSAMGDAAGVQKIVEKHAPGLAERARGAGEKKSDK